VVLLGLILSGIHQEIAESGDHAIVRVSLKARALLKQAEPHD